MTTPRISVISPCFNQARYVEACVRSMQRQTREDWEQIFVDDGSSDGTPEIIEGLGDPRVRVLRLPHRGLSALADSYNAGLAVASGDFIGILEGDDLWPSDKLEIQVAGFSDPNVFLSWGRAALLDADGAAVGRLSTIRSANRVVDFPAEAIFARLARTNVLVPAASVMIRRSALERIGGFQQAGSSLYADLGTWLTVTAHVRGTVRFINHELACYRVHAAQTTRRFGRRMSEEHGGIVDHVVSTLDEDTLRRLDWRTVSRDAKVARLIADGRGAIAEGDYERASRVFRDALRSSRRWADGVKASVGTLSATLRIDLLEPLLSFRAARIAGGSGEPIERD